MKKINVSQTIQTLANIGVIASIVFLGIEVRDAGNEARIGTIQEMIDQRSSWRDFVASDEELTDIFLRGTEDYQHLTPLERGRFDLIMRSFMHKVSGSYQARGFFGEGSPDSDINNRAIEGELLRLLDTPGFRDWFTNSDHRGLPETIVNLTKELDRLRTESDAGR